MIRCIVFSRDRAMQLDAMLRSLFLHCLDVDNADICILYKTTNKQHKKQYQDLIKEHSERVFFKQQQNFRQDLLSLLKPFEQKNFEEFSFGWLSTLAKIGSPLGSQFDRIWRRTVNPVLIFLSTILTVKIAKNHSVLFLVDDNLFVKDFYLKHIIDELRNGEKLLGFSLRLGKNTTYCYARGRRQSLPEFKNINNEIALFDWTKSDGDFGYPLEVSSSIYRLQDILPLLMAIPFDNPNTLEDRMAYHSRFFRNKRPLLACYQHSVTFCNPVNLVQSVMPNRAGEILKYSADELSSRFEQGERIQVVAYSGFTPEACHQEVDLIFEKHENRQYGF
jgi:hypothetical protein